MLSNAIASEGFKLAKNRWMVWWAVGFAAAGSILAGFFQLSQIMARIPAQTRASVPVDVSAALLQRAWGTTPETLSFFVAMIFLMFTAAVVYGGDYRWQTWRLIGPRNSRLNIFLGKVTVMLLTILAATVLLLVVGVLMALANALLNGAPMAWTFGAKPSYWLVFFSMYFVSVLHILQVTSVVAFAAVLTRSISGGLLTGLLVFVVQLGMQLGLAQQQGMPDFTQLLTVPGLAADVVRQHVGSVLINGQQIVPEANAQQALLAVILWILIPLAGAAALLLHQDLSKE